MQVKLGNSGWNLNVEKNLGNGNSTLHQQTRNGGEGDLSVEGDPKYGSF